MYSFRIDDQKVTVLGQGARWMPATPSPRFAAVFVHGWQGHFLDTWRKTSFFGGAERGLIDILAEDRTLARWQFFSVKHSASSFNPTVLRDVAGIVRTFLDETVGKRFEAIALIAHSLGGLACRRAILDEIDRKPRAERRIFGLLMFGTPNDGTGTAKAGGLVSVSAKEMRPYSDALRDLNAEWVRRIVNGGNPAEELDERATLLCRNVVGASDLIVPAASADHLALVGDVRTTDKDHIGLPKPEKPEDDAVTFTRTFLHDVEQAFHQRRQVLAGDVMAFEVRSRAKDAPWVRTQEETIKLESLPQAERPPLATPAALYRTTIDVVWTDVACRDVFSIGFSVQPAKYPSEHAVDFDYPVGRGIFGNAVDKELREGQITVDRLREYARVDSFRVTHGGKQLAFVEQPTIAGLGWFVVPRRCADLPADVTRLDRVELRVTRVIDLAATWWTFVSDVTATDRTEANFLCPFITTCLLHPPVSGEDEKQENVWLGGMYSNQVVYDGPLAKGARIIWVWGSTMATKKVTKKASSKKTSTKKSAKKKGGGPGIR